jgi:hypothetical protein
MLFTYASIFRITKLIQILSILGGLASDCVHLVAQARNTDVVLDSW